MRSLIRTLPSAADLDEERHGHDRRSRRALRRRRRQQVRRVHEPVRRCVVLVEAHAVVADPIHLLPGGEMLGVRPHGDLGLEVALRQRPRELLADLQVIEVLGIRQQIEDEDLHRFPPT